MAFMVSREPFPIKMKRIYLVMYISFFAMTCSSPKESLQEVAIPEIELSAHQEGLEKRGVQFLYNDKPFSGFLMEYGKEGQVLVKSGYLNGTLNGPSIRFYEDGSLQEKRFYADNKKEGIHKAWWPNGNQKFEYHFLNGLHEGVLNEWYANGQPLRQFNYVAGKESGPQKMWEIDGRVRANYVVRDGHIYGLIGLKNCKSVSNEKGVFASISY